MFTKARKIIRWSDDVSRSSSIFLLVVGIALAILFWQRERVLSGAVIGTIVTMSLILRGSPRLFKYLGKRYPGRFSILTTVAVGIALVITGVMMIVLMTKVPMTILPVVFGFTLMSLGFLGAYFVIAGGVFFLTLMDFEKTRRR